MKILQLLISFFLIFFSTSLALSNESSVLNLTEDDFIIGNVNAPITIIDYA